MAKKKVVEVEVVKAVVAPVRVREGGKHSVESAIAMIKRNGGLVQGKKIFHPTAGIKVLGAMDFLVHHCGFYVTKGV